MSTYCIACGAQLPAGSRFCWQCGERAVSVAPPPPPEGTPGPTDGSASSDTSSSALARREARAARRRASGALASGTGRTAMVAAAGAARGATAAVAGSRDRLAEVVRSARGDDRTGLPAGLAARVVGGVIDIVIVGSAMAVVAGVVAAVVALVAWLVEIDVDADRQAVAAALAVLVALASFYEPGFVAAYGRTPGKLAAGLELRRLDGSPVSFGRAWVRQLARLVSLVPLGLGMLWVAWDPRRQAWHDQLLGTTVVVQPSRAWRPVHGTVLRAAGVP